MGCAASAQRSNNKIHALPGSRPASAFVKADPAVLPPSQAAQTATPNDPTSTPNPATPAKGRSSKPGAVTITTATTGATSDDTLRTPSKAPLSPKRLVTAPIKELTESGKQRLRDKEQNRPLKFTVDIFNQPPAYEMKGPSPALLARLSKPSRRRSVDADKSPTDKDSPGAVSAGSEGSSQQLVKAGALPPIKGHAFLVRKLPKSQPVPITPLKSSLSPLPSLAPLKIHITKPEQAVRKDMMRQDREMAKRASRATGFLVTYFQRNCPLNSEVWRNPRFGFRTATEQQHALIGIILEYASLHSTNKLVGIELYARTPGSASTPSPIKAVNELHTWLECGYELNLSSRFASVAEVQS